MAIPITISVRGARLASEVRSDIRKRSDKLTHFHRRVLGCRVTIEGPGRHHQNGRQSVRLVVSVPDRDIAITQQWDDDLRVALGLAFDAAERSLLDRVRRRRDSARAS